MVVVLFYTTILGSILTFSITVWYAGSTAKCFVFSAEKLLEWCVNASGRPASCLSVNEKPTYVSGDRVLLCTLSLKKKTKNGVVFSPPTAPAPPAKALTEPTTSWTWSLRLFHGPSSKRGETEPSPSQPHPLGQEEGVEQWDLPRSSSVTDPEHRPEHQQPVPLNSSCCPSRH
ncbi:hypothetical protein WMY93_013222 [Mugilogobius chulae]|uniref:Uncharacterized protein n=1 Tax=Mugilogobius chulae TaxID=88201 RepID=A0AAW0NZB7_9GOBI